ncbi:SNF2 family N-terminal domain-containing protein [Xylaria grammica]|nr:SNF2 family N-terminal domain-containing protein [Xylaria grammica]
MDVEYAAFRMDNRNPKSFPAQPPEPRELQPPNSPLREESDHPPNYEVCYGALYHAVAKVLGDMRMSSPVDAGDTTPFRSFRVRGKDYIYVLRSENDDDFAVLDTRTAFSLHAISGTPMLRFEAIVQSSSFTKRQRRARKSSHTFPLSINIFGSRSAADDVADQLSKVSAYLQHPQSLKTNVKYHNPQLLTFVGEESDTGKFVGMANNSLAALNNKVSEEVGRILESLTHTNIAHQEDGVRFILQREEEAFAQQLSARLHHVVGFPNGLTKSISVGGLIADVMGLGKTLTTLAAILHSMPIAEGFSSFYQIPRGEITPKVHTKATLVIVSSVQLLESWISEIEAHFFPGALDFVRFHGQDRPRDPEALRSSSLVLTTYATLAADYAGQRSLYQMEWYRVVLDEAHWIRNSSSRQFRAAESLDTGRRWCLTGTPIQNRLDDLTSLAQFLKLPPLSTGVAFRKHILGPLSEGGPNFAKPLQEYLEAYCLRRSEKCLTLPPSLCEHVTIELSSEERRLYDRILHNTRRQIDSIVSTRDTRSSSKLFTAMLRMRMLCNLGTFSPAGASMTLLGQQSQEIGCQRCTTTDEDSLVLLDNYSSCPDCGRPLSQSSPLPDPLDSRESEADSSGGDAGMTLHNVASILEAQMGPLPRSSFSTKLSTVVENVVRSGSGTKSIIFSYWTSTLDILSRLLSEVGLPYRQVDGRTSYARRSEGLKAFKEDPQVLVLLMSIESGAVGLNLTVASNVHLVEPQWNPAVEEQAIARALRMGQTREVTIIRYVAKNTVEQNIIELQKKKRQIAKFTFGAGTETTSNTFEAS